MRADLPARSAADRLNTRQRRQFGAFQAQQLGHGGITRIAEITGLDWKTIRKGIKGLMEIIKP